MTPTALRAHVREHAENRPGVYRMVGPDDEVLYVGKSVRVRSRLLSYFRAEPGEKPHELIQSTRHILWEYVPNEFVSLVREMKLIQQWRPRFNVQHKRRRPYAFVKIPREPAPRLIPTRRVLDDDSDYYGPFPAMGHLAAAVRDLAHVIGLRDCAGDTPVFFADQLEIFDLPRTPLCLRGELGTCSAPCAGTPTSADYAARVREAHLFLEGESTQPIEKLDRMMVEAAARMEFEYAGMLRDRAERLRMFQEHLVAFRGRVESLTFVYKVPGYLGDDRLYLVRRGRIRGEHPYPRSASERRRLRRIVRSTFSQVDRGLYGLEPAEAAEILLIARWFRMNPTERKRTVQPARWLAPKRAALSGKRAIPAAS